MADAVNASLATDATMSSDQTADALAALCALDGLGSSEALQLLLVARRTWIDSQLQVKNRV